MSPNLPTGGLKWLNIDYINEYFASERYFLISLENFSTLLKSIIILLKSSQSSSKRPPNCPLETFIIPERPFPIPLKSFPKFLGTFSKTLR